VSIDKNEIVQSLAFVIDRHSLGQILKDNKSFFIRIQVVELVDGRIALIASEVAGESIFSNVVKERFGNA